MEKMRMRMQTVPEFSICLVRESRARFTAQQISSSEDCFNTFRKAFARLDREHFAVVCLSAKNSTIGFNVVSIGSLTMSPVHPREVFKLAVIQNAASVILAHNHPSGDPTPSKEDIMLTERIVSAGSVLGVQVLDHLVFGDTTYYSFADHELIRNGIWRSPKRSSGYLPRCNTSRR